MNRFWRCDYAKAFSHWYDVGVLVFKRSIHILIENLIIRFDLYVHDNFDFLSFLFKLIFISNLVALRLNVVSQSRTVALHHYQSILRSMHLFARSNRKLIELNYDRTQKHTHHSPFTHNFRMPHWNVDKTIFFNSNCTHSNSLKMRTNENAQIAREIVLRAFKIDFRFSHSLNRIS